MPTGYTAGIVDGTTKNFKDYATLCMRAFGATMHLRDENLDAKYIPQTPSDYHEKAIKKAKQLFKDANTLTDAEIVATRAIKLRADREYYTGKIEETKNVRHRLEAMLEDARAYEPPTPEHVGIKKFMIEQITETIRFDGETEYYDNKLQEIEYELHNLSAEQIRQDMIDTANKDLAYHKTELAKEVKRCNDSNTWVEIFLKSLDGQAVEAK